MNNWQRKVRYQPSPRELANRNNNRQKMVEQHGTPTDHPAFSARLQEKLLQIGKTVELFTYPGDDHNISKNFSLAMKRSVEFFDLYIKPEEQGGENR